MNIQFLKSDLWKKIWNGVRGNVTVTTNLRTIHTSWMLWLVAVAITVITSPFMMVNLYGREGSFLVISISILVLAWVGKRVGRKIVDTYVTKTIITDNIHIINESDIWFARISLFLIPLILIMDVASVASESYSMIYWVSVFLLVIAILLLALPGIIRKRR